MALLQFDERNFTLNAIAGALEKYTPSKEVKELQKKIEEFRQKAQALNAEIQEIRNTVEKINEDKYPELKELKAAQAAKQAEAKTQQG